MYILTAFLAAASSAAAVSLDFDDGYETVKTSTTPFQLRLAYQGPEAMMGL